MKSPLDAMFEKNWVHLEGEYLVYKLFDCAQHPLLDASASSSVCDDAPVPQLGGGPLSCTAATTSALSRTTLLGPSPRSWWPATRCRSMAMRCAAPKASFRVCRWCPRTIWPPAPTCNDGVAQVVHLRTGKRLNRTDGLYDLSIDERLIRQQ
eukprot:2967049-Prymnesium_polylepis.1